MELPSLIAGLGELSIVKLVSGIVGAFVSLKFVPGTWPERLFMVSAGAFLSYVATDPLASYLGMGKEAQGLVGFLVGLFGMAILSKLYEAFVSLDAKRMASDAWDWLLRKPPKG